MSVFHQLLNGSSGCQELLSCVFELNGLETEAYFALLATPDARVDEIADALDRDRSTAHRAVQTLITLELAERETEALEGGGYCYSYRATDPETVRDRIESRLEAFQAAVREKLEGFQEEARSRQEVPAQDPASGPSPTART